MRFFFNIQTLIQVSKYFFVSIRSNILDQDDCRSRESDR